MPPPVIVPGEPLPIAATYGEDAIARAFWRLSFRCGRYYARGKDALGHAILHKHEREEADSYMRRTNTAKVRNHCGPIIRKYNDYVFRRPAERPASDDGLYGMLLDDADGCGTPLSALIRHACRMAQIERESYLIPDSTAPAVPAQRSVAQAKAAGIRPIIRLVSADAVLWWRDRQGVLVEALVMLEDEQGVPFVNWYTDKTISRIDLDMVEGTEGDPEYKVARLGPAVAHNAGGCPVIRMRPMFDQDDDKSPGESQIAPLAELQQSIFNLISLLSEELYNVTFTQAILTGVSADAVKDAKVGNNRFVCLPDAQSKWQMIGADPAQAQSLRDAITDEQRELYRIAGVQTADPMESKGVAESGAARAFKFNDLAANLAALADCCEKGENAVIARLFAMNGAEAPEAAKYPDDFEMPVMADELEVVIRALTVAQLPVEFKRSIASGFADRNLALEPEDLEAALDSIGDDQSQSPIPFPGGAPTGDPKDPVITDDKPDDARMGAA